MQAKKRRTCHSSKEQTQCKKIIGGFRYSANNCYALRSKIRCTQNKVTTKITKNTTTSKKITTSKANKTYHVRIRTYKVAGGKTYYSAWSAAKAVKTK